MQSSVDGATFMCGSVMKLLISQRCVSDPCRHPLASLNARESERKVVVTVRVFF